MKMRRFDLGPGRLLDRRKSGGAEPPAPHPLAAYYGVGPGRIAIHYSTDGVIGTPEAVAGLRNLGGAGAVFDAASGAAPYPTQEGLYIRASGSASLTTAVAADIRGVRFMWVMDTDKSIQQRFFGSSETIFQISSMGLRVQSFVGGTWQHRDFLFESGIGLFETELTDQRWRVWHNGLLVGEQPPVEMGAFSIRHLGRGNNVTFAFRGLIGDALGVTLGDGADEAIAAARAYLNDRYNLGLAL